MIVAFVLLFLNCHCGDKGQPEILPPEVKPLALKDIFLENTPFFTDVVYGTGVLPEIRISFTQPVKAASVTASIKLTASGAETPLNVSLQNNDSTIIVKPVNPLAFLTKYHFSVLPTITSSSGGGFVSTISKDFITKIDPTPKFPTITDDELLTKVQQQTFKYFWDYGHPVSGLSRERSNEAPETVTSGGSGFGVMAIVTGIHRNFITRTQGLQRMQTIVSFLKDTAQKFHGAFPHWLNGTTGVVIPFSSNDNGADLVETSYLMAGLLTARQYFNGADAAETTLRSDINALWNGVEWNWFRKNNENVLYWHWSPNLNWVMNMQIKGWNECLITYILGASSTTYGTPAIVYQSGWASNGGSGFVNGNNYYGYPLPLGLAFGGPLFFSHYSFLGVNPNGLSDAYANYATQTKNHTLINYNYCIANPLRRYGYGDSCWGLTASDIPGGYTASSPTNDIGVISPTAALSSFPYTPVESMKALKYFYYTLGDKLWGEYGFKDAFSLKDTWFAGSYLAIDQGPEMVMIENYRTGLLWNLFTSCPEVKNGMRLLGFTAPYL
jgi:hypothetical protein